MATHESEETLSGGKPDAGQVANAFLLQYYTFLHTNPKLLHRFYKDESVLKWPGVESATTMEGINEKIMSSDYSGCQVNVINADAQESLMEGVVLTVTGCLLGKDNVKRIISQTFFLAKQERGFFVLNDNFRILDTQEILNHSFGCEEIEGTSIASHTSPAADESEPADVPAQPESEKELKGTEATDGGEITSDIKVTAAEILKKPITSTETPKKTVTPTETPKTPVTSAEILKKPVTPAEIPKKPVTSADIPKEPDTSTQNVSSPLASNEKLDGQKTSYASVVAKETKVASPVDNSGHKIIRVAASSNQHSVASSVPIMGSETKERTSSGRGSTENNSNIRNNSSSDSRFEDSLSRSVYIQNLPSDITKTELADAVKEFGQVKPADIQIRTFEDGFCFGFVEFESATSAKSAVEAHTITIKGYDSRISFKKSSAGRGGNGGPRMGGGGGGGFRGRSFRGQEKGEIRPSGGYRDDNVGQMRGGGGGSDRQNREFGQRNSSQGRDGGRGGYGGEGYPRNNWRNEERWSSNGGGGYNRRNSQFQNEGGITGAA